MKINRKMLVHTLIVGAVVIGSFASAQATGGSVDPFDAVKSIGATIATGIAVLVAAGVAILGASIGGTAAYRYAVKFFTGK
jgi:hypothetical protein